MKKALTTLLTAVLAIVASFWSPVDIPIPPSLPREK